jgi:hypothetical protein
MTNLYIAIKSALYMLYDYRDFARKIDFARKFLFLHVFSLITEEKK